MFTPLDGIKLVEEMRKNIIGGTVKNISHRVDYKTLTIEFDTEDTLEFGVDDEGYSFFCFSVRDQH